MKVTIRNLLLSHPLIKLFAVFCGYCFWLLLATNQITTRTFKIPLFFYNTQKKERMVAPETIEVTVKGKRDSLHSIEQYAPSVHLDAAQTGYTEQDITLAEGDILLPNNVNLVNYAPSTVKIHKEALEID